MCITVVFVKELHWSLLIYSILSDSKQPLTGKLLTTTIQSHNMHTGQRVWPKDTMTSACQSRELNIYHRLVMTCFRSQLISRFWCHWLLLKRSVSSPVQRQQWALSGSQHPALCAASCQDVDSVPLKQNLIFMQMCGSRSQLWEWRPFGSVSV